MQIAIFSDDTAKPTKHAMAASSTRAAAASPTTLCSFKKSSHPSYRAVRNPSSPLLDNAPDGPTASSPKPRGRPVLACDRHPARHQRRGAPATLFQVGHRPGICPPPDSNRHALRAADFKSAASTIPPGGQRERLPVMRQPDPVRKAGPGAGMSISRFAARRRRVASARFRPGHGAASVAPPGARTPRRGRGGADGPARARPRSAGSRAAPSPGAN